MRNGEVAERTHRNELNITSLCFMARRLRDYPDHHIVVENEGRTFLFDTTEQAFEWLRVVHGIESCGICGWMKSNGNRCACWLDEIEEENRKRLLTPA